MWWREAKGATYERGRGRSTFMGFDRGAVRKLIEGTDIRSEPPPPFTILNECLCLPKREALYDAEGRRIDLTMSSYLEPEVETAAQLDGKIGRLRERDSPAKVPPPPHPTEIEDPVLFLGTINWQYGHFLTDSLARAWAIDRVDPAMKVVFAPSRPLDLYPPFIGKILIALNITPERVILTHGPLRLRTVVCPLPLIQLGSRIYTGFDEPHRSIAPELSLKAGSGSDRPIYLSRTRMGPEVRRILGEEALEERLEREGYAIVHPQELALNDQIALFESRGPIVGLIGSAMHTALFRRSTAPLRLGMLSWRIVNGRFPMIDAVKGLDSAYLNCSERVMQPGEPADLPLNEQVYKVDATLAADMLSDAGFFGGRR